MAYRTAKYFRNGHGRSRGASEAEEHGRYPRVRAAKRLGVSTVAFDAGCDAIRYASTEWHHVGKYAAAVDYYDTAEIGRDSRFWEAAAAVYKSAAARARIARRAHTFMPSTTVAAEPGPGIPPIPGSDHESGSTTSMGTSSS